MDRLLGLQKVMCLVSLPKIVLTTSGFFCNTLVGFLDPTADDLPIDHIIYRDYPLRYCSVHRLQLIQTTEPISKDEVLA